MPQCPIIPVKIKHCLSWLAEMVTIILDVAVEKPFQQSLNNQLLHYICDKEKKQEGTWPMQ